VNVDVASVEIFELMEFPEKFSLESFKTMFRKTAHKYGIFHHQSKETYNYFFGITRSAVSSMCKRFSEKHRRDFEQALAQRNYEDLVASLRPCDDLGFGLATDDLSSILEYETWSTYAISTEPN
jgi:hypothetical protein